MSEKTSKKSPFAKLIWIALLGLIPLSFLFFSKSEDQTAALYSAKCSNCHMPDGKGLRGLIPPLAGADYLSKFEHKLPCIIKHGLQGEVMVNRVTYNQPMPANEELSEVDIANLVNYIRNEWGNDHPRISLKQIQEDLKTCNHE